MLHSMYMCHSSPLGCSMKTSRHCGGLFHYVTTYILYNHDNSVLSILVYGVISIRGTTS